MKRMFIVVLALASGATFSQESMVGKTESIQACLAAIKSATGRQLKIVTDTPENVSGFIMLDGGGHDYFGCTLKVTGAQGAYYEARYPAGLEPPKAAEKTPPAGYRDGIYYSVPSDAKAKYFILEKSGKGAERTITTRREGSSGISFSKRLYNCTDKTVKYLGTGDSLDAVKKSKPDQKMSEIFPESIAYYTGLEACK